MKMGGARDVRPRFAPCIDYYVEPSRHNLAASTTGRTRRERPPGSALWRPPGSVWMAGRTDGHRGAFGVVGRPDRAHWN